MTAQEYQFMQHERQLITGLIQSKQYMIYLKSQLVITSILYYYEDKIIDWTSYSYRQTAKFESALSGKTSIAEVEVFQNG